ncbi:MAG: hypothetical protein PCFJNLEI_00758 [Verrucomicrobiae bacterium]|nr:hypothetical protein [Verrucomicrobiae bacterium]
MQNRFSQFLMVLTLIGAIGAHWALLQSVAWVGMLATNARAYSLTEAITRTFDGQHPCQLCHAIAAGKQAEQNQSPTKFITKIDFWLTPSSCQLFPPTAWDYSRPVIAIPPPRLESPPAPPPRCG